MERRGRMFLCVLVMAVFLTACGLSESTETTLPAGVYSNGTENYYAIELMGGEKVSDYFVFSDAKNQTTFNLTTLDERSEYLGVVYCCTVEDGGVVAYRTGGTGLFLYFPETFPDDAIRNACTLWSLGMIEKSMSISEAQNYISGLAP